MTVEEFLRWDDGTDTRYELFSGEIVAMAPPSAVHGRIVANVVALVRAGLEPPCGVQVEAGIRIDETSYYQADAAVTCTKLDPAVHWVEDPVVLFEVLSPSTEDRDSHVKTPFYRALESVEEIVVLHSDQLRAELQRRGEGSWTIEDVTGPDGLVRLDSIGAELSLRDLYAGIDL